MTEPIGYSAFELAKLAEADEDEQYEAMKAWFQANYENPSQSLYHDSGEGGYQWFGQGPYDASEVLVQQFQDVVPDVVIERLVSVLEREANEWASVMKWEDYDHDLFAAISLNESAHNTLQEGLSAIESLLAIDPSAPLRAIHQRLLFANAITTLETYLSDTFINRIVDNQSFLQMYLDWEPAFRDRKIALKDIFRASLQPLDEAKKELLKMTWHNMAKVKPMYTHVLLIDLGDIGAIARAITIRHDIVHRNGRRADGTFAAIESEDVKQLVRDIQEIAGRIQSALTPGRSAAYLDDESPPF